MRNLSIDWKVPAGNFAYFLVLGFILALAGVKYAPIREAIGQLIDDQISGTTILVGLAPVAILVLGLASKKLHYPSRYGCVSSTLVVAPANFLITAAAVAAALNWAVFFSLYIATPDVTRGDVAVALVANALKITAIAAASYFYAMILLNQPQLPVAERRWFFWAVFICSWPVAIGFLIGMAQILF